MAMIGSGLGFPATPTAPRPPSFVDADGNVINRTGNPNKLADIADHCVLGTGPDDARVIQSGPGGYAVLSAKGMPSDFLTVPTAKVTGVEDPRLLQPGAQNYMADAWKAGREQAAEAEGTTADQLPRDAIALAVNSQDGRSQDRLHIHADRLDPALGQELKQDVNDGLISGQHWANVQPVNGHQYRAIWVDGADMNFNPFQMVHDQMAAEHGPDYARTHMGEHSIAVVGETNAQGRPGFVLIDGCYGSNPGEPNGPHDSGAAEEWLFGHANAPR